MFVLFFISISTLFLIYEMYSGALLAGFIAVETHPVGLIFFICFNTYIFVKNY